MKRILLFFVLPFVWVTGQELYPPFAEDLAFYVSFDRGMEADLSVGNSKVIWKLGPVQMRPGLHGQALCCGNDGARLRYEHRDNLRFDEPGTLVFFYRPVDWEQETPAKLGRCFFWGIESTKGFIGLQGTDLPRQKCQCERDIHLVFLFGKRLPNGARIYPALGKRGCQGWHMLALTWAGNQLSIKWDDTAARNYTNPLPLKDSDFPANEFTIGSHLYWRYLMDDVMIYSRRLTDEELNKLYRTAMKQSHKELNK